jgi:hypothetical protein
MYRTEVVPIDDERLLDEVVAFALAENRQAPPSARYDEAGLEAWGYDKLPAKFSAGIAAGLAILHDSVIAGDGIIYHDPVTNKVEARHVRITDAFADAGDGKYIMRQLEVYGCELAGIGPDESTVMHLDTRASNYEARQFFEGLGFRAVGRAALYNLDDASIFYEKTIRPPRRRTAV